MSNIQYKGVELEKKRVTLPGGIEIAHYDEGAGDAVLLLHGFPDTSYLWRHQVGALLEAGYRVIVPDLRGFGDSSKPQSVKSYELAKIVGDISAMLRALRIERCHVVGHDWGAAVAWLTAMLLGSKVDHLVVLSVGHPNAFNQPTIEQRERSWYMLLYQFEGVAEDLIRRNNWELFRSGITPEADLDEYIRDFSRTGALTAALNWYRANRHPSQELAPPRPLPPVRCPVLGLWGDRDHALLEEQIVRSGDHVTGPWEYRQIANGTHWLPLSSPGEVSDAILGFLGTHEVDRPVRARRRAF